MHDQESFTTRLLHNYQQRIYFLEIKTQQWCNHMSNHCNTFPYAQLCLVFSECQSKETSCACDSPRGPDQSTPGSSFAHHFTLGKYNALWYLVQNVYFDWFNRWNCRASLVGSRYIPVRFYVCETTRRASYVLHFNATALVSTGYAS